MKWQTTNWEKMFAKHILKNDLHPKQDTKNSYNSAIRKQTTQLKNEQGSKQTLYQRYTHMANKHMEKMINVCH